MPERRVHLDHAATTPVDPSVLTAMLPFLAGNFGNPASLYEEGQIARSAVDVARRNVAGLLGADPSEIVFTSGGSESDNHALRGVASAAADGGVHMITTAIEHHAVLSTARHLRSQGADVSILPVDGHGLVDPDDVRRAITPRTALVSVMHANNEVGSIQPIAEIGRITREAGVLFHTDAVQTFGHAATPVDQLGVDLLSLSGHKLYGPKGIGALYVRRGTLVARLLHGGGQEDGRRAGTLNVPGIIGLGEAAALAERSLVSDAARCVLLRDRVIDGVLGTIEDARLTGHAEQRLPGNASFCLADVEGEALLLLLDRRGFTVSSGSACSSGSGEASHVLSAIGVPAHLAHGALRVTVGRATTFEDVDRFLEALRDSVRVLRRISPRTGARGVGFAPAMP
ncbi:MAG TPA: aminotransferase class V-fold PLP-dependent enzyme [bacterium]